MTKKRVHLRTIGNSAVCDRRVGVAFRKGVRIYTRDIKQVTCENCLRIWRQG